MVTIMKMQYFHNIQMNTYLDTLKNLEKDQYSSKVYKQASKYSKYEDYLHQKQSKIRHKPDRAYEPKSGIRREEGGEARLNLQKKSQTVYYPVQRTQVEYQDREYIERVPKKRVVVDYIQKRQVQLVPKQVIKTDYYVVEHVRSYIKDIVPQVKIQTVKVPKTIKNIEYLPVEKQIIFHPNHLTDINQIKTHAKMHLQKQGVTIRQDAQFQPIAFKNSNLDRGNLPTIQINPPTYNSSSLPVNRSQLNNNSNILTSGSNFLMTNNEPVQVQVHSMINEGESKEQKIKTQQTRLGAKVGMTNYFSLSRKEKQNQQQKRKGNTQPYQQLGLSGIPIYTKQKYQMQLNSSIKPDRDHYEPADYSFAQRDHYRYNAALNSSHHHHHHRRY